MFFRDAFPKGKLWNGTVASHPKCKPSTGLCQCTKITVHSDPGSITSCETLCVPLPKKGLTNTAFRLCKLHELLINMSVITTSNIKLYKKVWIYTQLSPQQRPCEVRECALQVWGKPWRVGWNRACWPEQAHSATRSFRNLKPAV